MLCTIVMVDPGVNALSVFVMGHSYIRLLDSL